MKQILAIGTGGTIASQLLPDGLTPELTADQLLTQVPKIQTFCQVDCVQPFCIDSTNMSPAHWLKIAGCIREKYWQYDGSPSPSRPRPVSRNLRMWWMP